ncbi:hypothetical protein BDZ91DRAFT_731489 [Kalaharituber pfeilii]|nr:hypothetical protein BDZ91DRAFT_731489 [Kalaharituber pfeilii]
MSENILKRVALGQVVTLGALYDARRDTFLPGLSLLKGPHPPGSVTTTDIPTSDVKLSMSDSYKAKFDDMGISAELGASFLAGFVSVEGSGRYLADKRDSNHILQQSLFSKITTVHEKLNLGSAGLAECLALNTVESGIATHVVAEISWGAQSILTAKYKLSTKESRTTAEGKLKAEFEMLFLGAGGDAALGTEGPRTDDESTFELMVYGDVLPDDGLLPTDFPSAQVFLKNIPRYISRTNGGKGTPQMYSMLPLQVLSIFFPLELSPDIAVRQLRLDCLESFVQFFDEVNTMQQTLNHYCSHIESHSFCVPNQHILDANAYKRKMQTAAAALKSQYATVLSEVRCGKSDIDALWQVLSGYQNGVLAPKKTVAVTHAYKNKVEFVDMVMERGATYFGYGSKRHSLDAALSAHHGKDAYIFYISDQATHKYYQLWTESVALLLELLQGINGSKECVFVVDRDAIGGPKLEQPQISHRRNGKIITQDLLKERKLMADKCVVRCDGEDLDRTLTSKPVKRKPVRLPCPRLECSQHTICDWICSRCFDPVDYSDTDHNIYCSCGRSHFSNYTFKCQDPNHGLLFEQYATDKLGQLLSNLESFNELNILILGETGVGKSTFVNAFINYQTFHSLRDAMDSEELVSVIPCSFFTQFIDENDKLVEKKITVGSGHNDDEHDGTKGQSATQKTTVYALSNDSDITIRLIDTPGIGDTRGLGYDKKNMEDILLTLRKYDRLHGIMILLRSDKARLQIGFRFCIKELLTHLHRDAARNVVFCFTNTRGSNYQPGDTYKPLQTLLSELTDIDIGLYRHTVYCFDSESFRYLAAHKQNFPLGDFDDYRRSWEKSAAESQRLLKHFRSLKPHQVTGTLNLNSTRHLLARLTRPMANIAQTIAYSVRKNEDTIHGLSTQKLERAELEQRLYITKMTCEARKLDKPRTVCAHADCVRYLEDPNDKENSIVCYDTRCHNPCGLDNVEADKIGDQNLLYCDAFLGHDHCRRCNHHWTNHLHVLYETYETEKRVRNVFVEKEMADYDTDIDLKNKIIAEMLKMIEEYKGEHRQIQTAAAQFCLFLKKNSITPYNDATLEYLDVLIKEEKGKLDVGGGGNRNLERLRQLEKDRKEHLELVEAMTDRKDNEELLDERSVHELVEKLYALPHFGKDLKTHAKVVEMAEAETYRERPLHVRNRSKSSTSQPTRQRTSVPRSSWLAGPTPSRASASRFERWKQAWDGFVGYGYSYGWGQRR